MKENYPDDRVLITVERQDFTAVMTPHANGDVYFNEKVVGRVPKSDAPFKFDMYYERLPEESEVQEVVEEVADSMREQFNERVMNVWEQINEADDPLETILELEEEDIA